jgi:hypothetical protein
MSVTQTLARLAGLATALGAYEGPPMYPPPKRPTPQRVQEAVQEEAERKRLLKSIKRQAGSISKKDYKNMRYGWLIEDLQACSQCLSDGDSFEEARKKVYNNIYERNQEKGS